MLKRKIPLRDADVRAFCVSELKLSKNSVRKLTKEELIILLKGRGYVSMQLCKRCGCLVSNTNPRKGNGCIACKT